MVENFRVGNGFDVHPWSEQDQGCLVLGGVRFPGEKTLQGYSDADVIAHACLDAVVSPIGLGDIGTLFSDQDSKNQGADSLEMLAYGVNLVQDEGWSIVNVDCTIIIDRPKISPHREKIRKNLSDIVGGFVTIKGKRSEGIPGLKAGAHCYASALLKKSNI